MNPHGPNSAEDHRGAIGPCDAPAAVEQFSGAPALPTDRQRDDGRERHYTIGVSPRTRPQPVAKWDELTPEARATLEAGADQAERGEFVDLTPDETEHYLRTGELPERVERCLDSYASRQHT